MCGHGWTTSSHVTSCFRDNLIELRIYYESMIVSEVRQEPEMTIVGILGKDFDY
jgi:hypothetical protein